jgi:glucokinase
MLIAGDIGGTKTDLAIVSVESGPDKPLAKTTVHNENYPSIHAIVKEFLDQVKLPVDRACFDVAALVLGGAFFYYSARFALQRSIACERQLLFASIVYLPVLFALLALDKK